MTELTAEDVPDTINLMVPVEVSGDVLAVSLANSNNTYEQLVNLIHDLDQEVGDWSFTRMLLEHFATVYLELATEDDNADLLEVLNRLIGMLPKD